MHGGPAGPGRITAEAKAALGGTVMVPTAAGGQVNNGVQPLLYPSQSSASVPLKGCPCVWRRRSTLPRRPSRGGYPASGPGRCGMHPGACTVSSRGIWGARLAACMQLQQAFRRVPVSCMVLPGGPIAAKRSTQLKPQLHHCSWVRSVAFDPSNEWFATGSGATTARQQ